MKPLRPFVIVTVGPVFLALAVVGVVWIAIPDFRRVSDVYWPALCGAVLGLAMFGPFAATLAIRNRYPGWLERHYSYIGWYASMLMGLAMGYMAACFRHTDHEGADPLFLMAFAVVFFAAVVKSSLFYVLRPPRNDKVAKDC